MHPSAAADAAQTATKATESARIGRLLAGLHRLLGVAADVLPALVRLLPAGQQPLCNVQARRLGLQGHRGLDMPRLADGATASALTAAAASTAEPAVPR